MVKRSPPGEAPQHVVVRSIAFTPTALEALENLATRIANTTGRKTSVSAVVRSLIRHVDEHPQHVEAIAALVDHERTTEVVWGKPPRAR